MTLEATAFGNDAFRRTPNGYEIDVRLPSYRSLPLSCIEGIGVTIGEYTPEPDALRFRNGSNVYALTDMADRADEEWFVRDAITIIVPEARGGAVQGETDLEVRLRMRIPYMIMDEGVAMIQMTNLKRKVSFQ